MELIGSMGTKVVHGGGEAPGEMFTQERGRGGLTRETFTQEGRDKKRGGEGLTRETFTQRGERWERRAEGRGWNTS